MFKMYMNPLIMEVNGASLNSEMCYLKRKVVIMIILVAWLFKED